jgi:2-methylcitrate dehydratase PrpD
LTIARQLAQMVVGLSFDQLSEEVVDRTKYLALDYVGLSSRGNTFKSSESILFMIASLSKGGKATVVGQGSLSLQPHYVALANGAASHSLELDDVINDASLHPAVVVFPTAFAIGEEHGKSGQDVITASVAGYEVMGQLGKALNPTNVYARGYHPTGVVGAFAAVATAGKLIGLTEEQLVNAFGIVGSQAAALMEFLNTGSWTKRLHPGWAAHNGIIACELAKNGFTGPESIIEGDKGFAQAYSSDFDSAKVQLGTYSNKSNAILKTSIKPHACCRYKQGPLDIILNYVKENDVKAEDIKKIDINLVKTAMPIVCYPEIEKRNPQSSVDAQFSMHFGAAVAVVHRRTLLEQYADEVTQEPSVKAMMEKVFCHHDPELDKEFPQKWPARVIIETTSGTVEKSVEFPKGDPENPLTWEEMIDKFNYVSKPIFNKDEQQQLVDAIRDLENIAIINEISQLLKGGVNV